MSNVSINGKYKGGWDGAERLMPVIGTVEFKMLDEESSPAAIARDQRRDVLASFHGGCKTAEKISNCLWLEIWVVRRRMHELGIGPEPSTKLEKRPSSKLDEALPRIVEFMKDGPKRTTEIAHAAEIPVQSCLSILRSASDRFVSEMTGQPPKTILFWRLKIGPVQNTGTAEERSS